MLSKKYIQEIINESAKTGADYVEVFLEDSTSTSISLLEGKIENAGTYREYGLGLRIALGTEYVYGYTNSLDRKSVFKLVEDLRSRFNAEPKAVTPLGSLKKGNHHKALIDPATVPMDKKVALLVKSYDAMREYSKEITQGSTRYLDSHQKVWIAKMDGRFVFDERIRTRFYALAYASDETTIENGHSSYGASMGFELFDKIDVVSLAKEASKSAVNNLHAQECPSGEMPVIIESGFGGTIFHEAVGHSLEATSVAYGMSVFCGKLGEKVAQSCVSAIDDGTIENEWGSQNFDDEGNKQVKRVLIKNGVLTSYMIDEINARKMGCAHTASGRRESYKYCPTSRMSNTYICAGKSSLEDMLKGIKLGLYAKSISGGSVNPATGDFNFAVDEGYLIVDGKIDHAVKGASLVGAGRQVLMDIDMVGDNLKLSQGMCGSASGSVPVDCGQPRIRVSKMTVGGRG